MIMNLAEASPSPSPTPSCAKDDPFCGWIWDVSGSVWAAEGSYYFLVKPLRIVAIMTVKLFSSVVFI